MDEHDGIEALNAWYVNTVCPAWERLCLRQALEDAERARDAMLRKARHAADSVENETNVSSKPPGAPGEGVARPGLRPFENQQVR